MTGTPATATALHLLLAAERLFAERGIAGVSLRQIAAQAGSANSSAVHYHFGSKERLVAAIFAYRVPQLVQRRALLNARLDPQDLRERLEAHLLPIFELAESPDSSYVSFVEQLRRSRESRRIFGSQSEIRQPQVEFLDAMRLLLPCLDEPLRTMRIQHVQVLSLHAAAEREQSVAAGEKVIPFGLFVSAVVDGFAGYLNAPVSEETQRLFVRLDRPFPASALPVTGRGAPPRPGSSRSPVPAGRSRDAFSGPGRPAVWATTRSATDPSRA
ncbi:transcriptional regulator, TetR family [Parafrankia sp. EAN1pec]|uniref:TetR/AcrR family transcriptional regulator n=1 Tax=Parafrankia sp. (strain EAN1pec) TaxID=298653 RepID=UPI00015D9E93|nr:transcriptional regulator, TetR family [Frankia sp. EAN1pec]